MKEINPSYLKAFGKTFGFFFIVGSSAFPLIAYLQDDPMTLAQAFAIGLICGAFLGALGTIVFTPGKTEWNDFMSFLRAGFPDKKKSIWLGPIPLK